MAPPPPGSDPGRSPHPFPPAPAAEGDEIEVGYVAGVFGVQGEVRLHLHHRESTLLHDGREVVLVDREGARHRAHLKTRSGAGKRVLGRFRTRLTREQAADLKGWTIRVPAVSLPALDDGEFWVWQVKGAPVLVDGERIGRVVEVHSTGPIDVFEVKLDGEREHAFVAARKDVVRAVSAEGLELVERP